VKVEMVVVGWELEFVGVDDSETRYRSMVRVSIRTGPQAVGFSDDRSVDLELGKTNGKEPTRNAYEQRRRACHSDEVMF
jgi:hypothetical protein